MRNQFWGTLKFWFLAVEPSGPGTCDFGPFVRAVPGYISHVPRWTCGLHSAQCVHTYCPSRRLPCVNSNLINIAKREHSLPSDPSRARVLFGLPHPRGASTTRMETDRVVDWTGRNGGGRQALIAAALDKHWGRETGAVYVAKGGLIERDALDMCPAESNINI